MFWTQQSVNHWPDNKCAKAFWSQHELPPYRQLLADTTERLDPQAGERWLDLGCGRGMLTRAVWEKSGGAVAEVIGLDCAEINAEAYAKLEATLEPKPSPGQVRFKAADFSRGLQGFCDGSFDGIVSGLSISYAESYSDAMKKWTTAAYDLVLCEAARLLKTGGRFIFSVNVPEPAWHTVALDALRGTFQATRPHRFLLKSWRIYRYGGWLKREARRGRFHYLPLPVIREKLTNAGFTGIAGTLSFSGQAYLISCTKSANWASRAA